MIESIVTYFFKPHILEIEEQVDLLNRNGKTTEAELLRTIDILQLSGDALKNGSNIGVVYPILKMAYNVLRHSLIGNGSDFIMVDLEQSNLKIELWYNGHRIVNSEHTDKTRQSLQEAVHYLRTRYHLPIGFNG